MFFREFIVPFLSLCVAQATLQCSIGYNRVNGERTQFDASASSLRMRTIALLRRRVFHPRLDFWRHQAILFPMSKNQFENLREAHGSETAQDYVEAIADLIATHGECRLVDVAKWFAVSHVTANRTIARLKRDGFAESEPYKQRKVES
jgi:hypothetical protein